MTPRIIVVIEDDPVLRIDAVDLFESAGLTVSSFERGDDAVAFVQADPSRIAGIFADIGLPGETDGLALAALVSDTLPEVALVLTSGHVQERPDSLGRRVRFLAKPWHPLDVINAMQDAELDDGPD